MVFGRVFVRVSYCVRHRLLAEAGSSNYSMRHRPQTVVISGTKIALDIKNDLRNEIQEWSLQNKRNPSLVAVLVGDDPASIKYVEKKMEAADYVGITSRTERLPASISESELIDKINDLNKDPSIDGILVQLPVPAHISERNVCNAVYPTKDVDGFHVTNMGKLALNMEAFVPCTVLAVIELIKRAGVETFGKNVVVCGRSKNIGLPISMILHSDARNELPGMEATVTLCHRNTPPEQLRVFTKTADIIISATGVVHLIKADMVKDGACVIDVGTTRVTTPEGKVKLVGDVDFAAVSEVAGCITPVPGGVGPMTVAMLMQNTFKAAIERSKQLS